MDNDFPVRQPSLSEQVYSIIVKGISNGTYPPGSLLPSENQLAERFNVSRPTIRSAFARLRERGYVKRQRGVGTYVSDSLSIVNPIYQMLDVPERIAARGYTSGFLQLKAELIEADHEIAQKLDIEVGSQLLNIHKVFTADGEPIILFINFIPVSIFQDCLTLEEALEPGSTEPFFEFFASKCNHPVNYLASIIRPEIAKNIQLPDIFEFEDPYKPLLVVEDTGYDADDNPVFQSYEHLVGDASLFHVVRHVGNI